MEPACTKLTEATRSVHRLQINGYSAITTMSETDYIKSRWNVDGYDWEVRFYPSYNRPSTGRWVALKLFFLSEPRTSKVRANFSCRLVEPSWIFQPSEKTSLSHIFQRRQEYTPEVFLLRKQDVLASGYLKNDSLTVECAITVLKELTNVTIVVPAKKEALPVPSSNLRQHLGALLQSQTGADVMLDVSGETFAVHKNILAARSPVFMAEFFGQMEERSSKSVEIEDMEAAVFKAMLHFIYTDMAPELDEPQETAVTMAQHLLAAADRYGLYRLKMICEAKLSGGIDVDTAATTLALAEQHNCSLLKANCVEFITESPEKLDAVLATEGYKHLAASCPLVLAELLKAARGRKI